MRRILFGLMLVLASKGFSYDEYLFFCQGSFLYTGRDHGSYYLSGFSFKSGDIYAIDKNRETVSIGTVEKLREWTRSYVFKVGDSVLSTHRSYLISCGILFDRLKEYEICDENNQVIGFIQGVWDTSSSAQFFFYKENQELFAKATLDSSHSNLTITDPDGQILITAERTLYASKSFLSQSSHNEYYWRIKEEKKETFSAYFLWPFIGFLSEIWWN